MGIQSLSSTFISVLSVPRFGFQDANVYRQVVEEIGSLSNSLVIFTDLRVSEPKSYLYQSRILLHLETNGRTEEFYLKTGGRRGAFDTSLISFINRALAENNIDQTLYAIDLESSLVQESNMFYYVLLSAKSYQDLQEEDKRLLLQIPQIWRTDAIKKTISGIEQVGLLNNIHDVTRQAALQEILRSKITSALDVVLKLPFLVYSFDLEHISDGREYINLVYETCQITRGVLHPRSVQMLPDAVEGEPKNLRLFLEHNGQEFAQTLSLMGEWTDLSYLRILEQASKDMQSDAHFRFLDYGSQDVYFVYVNCIQAELLAKLGLQFRAS